MMAVRLLSAMADTGCSLGELVEMLPAFSVATRSVNCSENPGELLRRLGVHCVGGQIGEGVVVQREKGQALIRPSKRGGSIRLLAEAVNAEIAGELCDGLESAIHHAAEGHLPNSTK